MKSRGKLVQVDEMEDREYLYLHRLNLGHWSLAKLIRRLLHVEGNPMTQSLEDLLSPRLEVWSKLTVHGTVLQTLHTGSQRSVISFWWIDAVEEHFYVCWLEMKYSQCMQSEWRNILTISRYLSVNTNNSQTIHNTIELHSKHYILLPSH